MPDDLLAGQVAPVQNEAAQTQAVEDNTAPHASQTDGEAGDTSPAAEKTFTQKELDDILQKRIAKAEARAERRVMRTLERFVPQQPQAQQAPSQSKPDEPSRDHFGNDAEYLQAMVKHELGKRDAQAAHQREQQSFQALVAKTEKIYAEAQKIDGFDREDFDALPLTKPIVEALTESDQAAQLMAFMSANPEEIERIATLSPARQSAEIGKLEARISSAPKPPTPSKAPRPLEQVRGSAKGVPNPSDSAAWIRFQNERELAFRKGK